MLPSVLVSIRPTPAASSPSDGSPAHGCSPGGAAGGPAGAGPALRRALERNLAAVRQRLAAAAGTAQAAPALVAVTKAVPDEVAEAVLALGCTDLGENRADPFVRRARRFSEAGLRPTWHFIGHLQRNKVRRVLEHAHVLHSVDSERLADTVCRISTETGRPVEVFVQVNLTGEEEKHGLPSTEAAGLVRRMALSPGVGVRGIMCMGPLREHRSTREVFEEAGALARRLESEVGTSLVNGRCELSMGMSGDAELAAGLGSDLVRIGSALYRDLPGSDDPAAALGGPADA